MANSTLQQISGEIGNASSSHDVVIGLESHGQGDAEALDAGKTAIIGVLQKMYGQQDTKPDFNSQSPAALTSFLTQKDPLNLGAAGAGDRYTKLAQALADARDKEHGGIVTNLRRSEKCFGRESRDHFRSEGFFFARQFRDSQC